MTDSNPIQTQSIYCCGCQMKVEARLTDGKEIYPRRSDLSKLPFWRCDGCHNWVGCHHKTRNRTQPLGCIPTVELRKARQHIHAILDPLWIGRRASRSGIYDRIAKALGRKSYHTANIKSIEEAREVYRVVKSMAVQS